MQKLAKAAVVLNTHQRPEQETCWPSNPRATVNSMRAMRGSEDQQVSG
jgi:hypothetical protein